MYLRTFIATAFLLLAVTLPTVAGQQTPPPERVQIVADQKAGAVRIVIDGREQAIIDATGLRVRGDIAYGGSSTDTGADAFDAYAAENEPAGHDAR